MDLSAALKETVATLSLDMLRSRPKVECASTTPTPSSLRKSGAFGNLDISWGSYRTDVQQKNPDTWHTGLRPEDHGRLTIAPRRGHA